MKAANSIDAYVAEVAQHLDAPLTERRRILEEIDGHLRDAAARHEAEGLDHVAAVRTAVEQFGPPEEVAAEFTRGTAAAAPTPRSKAPLWIPGAFTVIHLMYGLYALTWIPGMTVGQRAFTIEVYTGLAIHAGLTLAAWYGIRQRNSPRLLVWAPSGLAIALLVGTTLSRAS